MVFIICIVLPVSVYVSHHSLHIGATPMINKPQTLTVPISKYDIIHEIKYTLPWTIHNCSTERWWYSKPALFRNEKRVVLKQSSKHLILRAERIISFYFNQRSVRTSYFVNIKDGLLMSESHEILIMGGTGTIV